MSPRIYRMTNRDHAREATRRRIIEATIDLHTQKGILQTSWKDIAEHADVAVATVYNHFPSLDELVPACGDLLMERLQPPKPEDAASIVGDAVATPERLGRIARELFAFYERGGAHLEVFPGELELPAMREWESHQRATVESFVRTALRGSGHGARMVRLLSAFFDLGTFRALRERGVGLDEAVITMTDAAACALERAERLPTRKGKR